MTLVVTRPLFPMIHRTVIGKDLTLSSPHCFLEALGRSCELALGRVQGALHRAGEIGHPLARAEKQVPLVMDNARVTRRVGRSFFHSLHK